MPVPPASRRTPSASDVRGNIDAYEFLSPPAFALADLKACGAGVWFVSGFV